MYREFEWSLIFQFGFSVVLNELAKLIFSWFLQTIPNVGPYFDQKYSKTGKSESYDQHEFSVRIQEKAQAIS